MTMMQLRMKRSKHKDELMQWLEGKPLPVDQPSPGHAYLSDVITFRQEDAEWIIEWNEAAVLEEWNQPTTQFVYEELENAAEIAWDLWCCDSDRKALADHGSLVWMMKQVETMGKVNR